MKKWLIATGLLIIVGLSLSVYLLIPSRFVITRSSENKVTLNGAYRVLSNKAKWGKWWPNETGSVPANSDTLQYNGFTFHLTGHETNIIGIEISRGNLRLNSIMHLLTVHLDSTLIVWTTDTLPAGIDPVTRLLNFKKAAEISNAMKAVLQTLKPYISKQENVYDFKIFSTVDRDSTMLSSRFTSPEYPTTPDIYGYIGVINKCIEKQKGLPISHPIMNIRKLENGLYETQVAVPTNRKLNGEGKIVFMRMVPSAFMYTDATGGQYTANEAFRQLQFYNADYNKWNIANPFQMLITDRMKETDTLKWITRIYIPIVP
jgi:hypothetical protein